ncbi:MAG TPA: 30S ribosomal protein S20 [Lentisphaeria bacterium]|nr:MAG: 30S ribosomal protein S20 [Lentisphaerae bacterium GWF2_50_93]HCE43669.1 30S ribosomal protein S20 [Lentisphaeria bacterium]
MHTKSAAKRLKTSEAARIKHKSTRRSISTVEKEFRATLSSTEPKKDAKKLFSELVSMFDKAVKYGSLHKNKADRKKSRLAKLLAPKSTK